MNISNGDIAIIPAEKIEENEKTVIITYMGKRTIINNATIINILSGKGNVAFARLTNTKLGIIVEPIYSEQQDLPFSVSAFPEKYNIKFTIEEFVDIILNNLEVRTAISNGRYTFYHNNLIPTNWTMLNEQNLSNALKKIANSPVLSEKKINDKMIYQIDDYASRIPVFTSQNVDDIVVNYSFTEREDDTVGKYLSFIMEHRKIISARLYEMTGIDKSTISEYLNDKRSQQKNYLVAISVALRLLPKQSKYLLSLADIFIGRKTQENMLYQLFLDSCAFNEEITVSKCNAILIGRGLQPLTNLRVDE